MRFRRTILGLATLVAISALLLACTPSAAPAPTAPAATPTKPAAAPTTPAATPTTAAAATPTKPAATPTTAVTAPPAASPVAPGGTADLAAGKTVYTANCNACHPDGGKGVGPDIKGKSPDVTKNVVRKGAGAMPAYPPDKISDQQLDALAAYVASLK